MTQKGTTICAVKRGDQVAIAGDGQVTMGENTVFKSSAKKVRRLYEGKVIAGFAGAVADAFTLCERFEEKLTQCGGNLERAAVNLAQEWRGDSAIRKLESMLIVADKNTLLVLSGNGEVIDPDDGVCAIGSGRQFRPGGGACAGAQHQPFSRRNRREGIGGSRIHLRVYQRPYHR